MKSFKKKRLVECASFLSTGDHILSVMYNVSLFGSSINRLGKTVCRLNDFDGEFTLSDGRRGITLPGVSYRHGKMTAKDSVKALRKLVDAITIYADALEDAEECAKEGEKLFKKDMLEVLKAEKAEKKAAKEKSKKKS